MTGRAETHGAGAKPGAVARRSSPTVGRGLTGDRSMAVVELGVAMAALAAAVLLAVVRG